MAYTTPKTWTNEPLIATDMNTYIRDNQIALKDPPSDNYEADEVSDYSTTSATMVDVDATNYALTITTTGGDVMVHFHGMVRLDNNAGAQRLVSFDVDVDGTPHAGNDGITGFRSETTSDDCVPLSFTRLITGLSAGSHTFKLQWAVGATCTAYLAAGAGTTRFDTHSQFWAREIS